MLFSPDDIKDLNYKEDLGNPGEYPFTRGVYPTMYTGRLWTMRQYAGYATAEESNRRYKYLLRHGQTGLSVAFDLPTQMGYDSDCSLSEGEVGKTGVAIDTLEDMEILFSGIPLDKVSTSMTINATASILLAMYIAVAEKQGVSKSVLAGTVQNDILKEYIARGTYIYPPGASIKIIVDIMRYCGENLPKWNTISVSGYHIREAGATAVQELAFTLANGITYVQVAIEKGGLNVDSFAPRLSFFFNAQNNFFEEIAKFRAARRIWARIMRKRFKAKNPKSWVLRFHTQTAGSTLTAQEPNNNAIRVAFQALAAVLGGTQSLHTNSRDEALTLPTEESVKLALRTQQIIAYESRIPEVIDPLAGSYYVESLTNELEKEVNEYLEKIEEMGGTLAAIENGYLQKEIHKSAYEYQKAVENGEIAVIGVNKFVTEQTATKYSILKVASELVKKQIRKIRMVKQRRNNKKVKVLLNDLKKAAIENLNLMKPILKCVKEYATIGEISDTLREVYGEYKEKNIF
ncbi:methylmalonyl-CoA mutase [candidate division WOR-3 bacterium]|jgi:methylmalonyl-CoA mutase N-terminal domain/subunit|nr:methylmalonyl-CoA mutase [candidate division WOR-3 bacterium]